MTNQARTIVAVSLIAAVAVLAGLSSSAQSGITETSSTSSGGCLPPSLSADLWALQFPHSEGLEEDRDRDCDILCRSHVRKCRRIVRLTRTCNSGTAGTIAGLISDVCDTIPDRENRRSCRRSADSFRTELRECITEDALAARDCCENNYQACFADCTDDEGPGIQQCFTGGSCLFDLFNTTVD